MTMVLAANSDVAANVSFEALDIVGRRWSNVWVACGNERYARLEQRIFKTLVMLVVRFRCLNLSPRATASAASVSVTSVLDSTANIRKTGANKRRCVPADLKISTASSRNYHLQQVHCRAP